MENNKVKLIIENNNAASSALIIPTPIVAVTTGGVYDTSSYNTKSLKLTINTTEEKFKDYNPQYLMWVSRSKGSTKGPEEDEDNRSYRLKKWRHPAHEGGLARDGSKWYGGGTPSDLVSEWALPIGDYSELILDSDPSATTGNFSWLPFFSYFDEAGSHDIPSNSHTLGGNNNHYKPKGGSVNRMRSHVYIAFTVTLEDPSFGDYPFMHSDFSRVIRVGMGPYTNGKTFYNKLGIGIL